MGERTAVIIGAGPAGLTAAHELLERSDIKPVVFEASPYIGGISKTIHHMGNHIDIGGHRFFSKSKRVMDWWQSVLPLQGKASRDYLALGRDIPLSEEPGAPDPEKSEKVMLVRQRLSRILFAKKLLSYPISLSIDTLSKLGIPRTIRIVLSYLRTRIVPVREEKSLEDFFINRFGRELYQTFFLDYTEKVWGVPCSAIKPEWGSQRVKGLSITKVFLTAVKRIFSRDKSIEQQDVETSLIERFLYPKYGPGQMWEEVAERIMARGCSVHLNKKVTGIEHEGGRVVAVNVTDMETGELERRVGDFFLSTMPVRDLIAAMGEAVPSRVAEVARGLMYRDFITVGILLRKMKIRNESKIATVDGIIPDNWVYIQEKDVRLGRLQIFNNWSPYLVRDEKTVWIGAEYFCNEGDEMWTKPDEEMAAFAVRELEEIGYIEGESVLDSVVIREPKAYPAYFGTYDSFPVVREYTDCFGNLFLLGRNGMHRYNNQDHSMLSAMETVQNIVEGKTGKENVWQINVEQEYQE